MIITGDMIDIDLAHWNTALAVNVVFAALLKTRDPAVLQWILETVQDEFIWPRTKRRLYVRAREMRQETGLVDLEELGAYAALLGQEMHRDTWPALATLDRILSVEPTPKQVQVAAELLRMAYEDKMRRMTG